MGDVSADGKVLWLSGRFDNVVYAIDTYGRGQDNSGRATASWRSAGRVSVTTLKANGFQTSAQAIHAGQVKVKLNLLGSKQSSLIVLAQGGQHSDVVLGSSHVGVAAHVGHELSGQPNQTYRDNQRMRQMGSVGRSRVITIPPRYAVRHRGGTSTGSSRGTGTARRFARPSATLS
jgi:hypothetical protein